MRLLLFVSVVVLFGTAVMAGPRGAGASPAPDEALIIVDIQNFYFEGGSLPLTGSVEAARQARRLLEAFRAKGLPVIHVRHLPENAQDGDQYRIHAEVTPLAGEKVIIKHFANSFRETDLLDHLRKIGTRRIVLCGMQTHMCVEAAARAASDLGFDVTVVADACATRPLEFGGRTVPADMVHAAALAALKGTYAKVVSVDELMKEK